jgi:hypothetical protein
MKTPASFLRWTSDMRQIEGNKIGRKVGWLNQWYKSRCVSAALGKVIEIGVS